MLLRSITRHVKEQNWLALVLDFVIVVVGVGMALAAERWMDDRQQAQDLQRAKVSIHNNLLRIYMNFSERLAIDACLDARIDELALLLAEHSEDWAGLNPQTSGASISEYPLFSPAIYSPGRPWRTRFWEVELARGTFDQMGSDQRQLYDAVFDNALFASELQLEIRETESALRVLNLKTKLPVSERLRLTGVLTRYESLTHLLSIVSEQTVEAIEQIDLALTPSAKRVYRDRLADVNNNISERYVGCGKQVVLPVLSD